MEAVSLQDECLPLVADDLLLPDGVDMASVQSEKDLAEIKETLRWHARIGWGIAGIYAAIFSGLLVWYLPKELNTQKDAITQTIQLEIGKIPTAVLNKLILPNSKIVSATPSELQERFQQIAHVTDTVFSAKLIVNPDLLTPVQTFLQTSLTLRSKLPQSVRQDGVSALVRVAGYTTFTQDQLNQADTFTFEDLTIQGSSGVWPTTEWVKVTSSKAGAVVARNVLIRNMRQDVTGLKLIGTTFDHSVIIYNGGDLYLSDVIFKDCTFLFGDDAASKKFLAALNSSPGSPVTVFRNQAFSSLEWMGSTPRGKHS